MKEQNSITEKNIAGQNGNDHTNGNDKIIEPKKFLFVALEPLSGDLAWQLKKEGHEVKVYIKAKNVADVYSGFVDKVDNWESHKDWADVVIFDDMEFGEVADKLRRNGKLVIGGSVYTDRLEMDRDFGQTELKKYGVNILPQWQFTNYDEAIDFIEKNPERYVFKPGGNVPSSGKVLSFLGQEEDGKDLLELLKQNKTLWLKKIPVFQLQKFVSGVEVAIGAFFNGQDFILPININFEHKRIFPGDIGPFSGEMGTLMFWSESNKLFKMTLEKMKPALVESGYIGYLDINCIVNGKGIYPLEWTTRFGYPTIQIQLEGILTPTGEWLYKLAHGENFDLKTKKGFQVGVRILVPTFLIASGDKELIELYRDLPILFKKLGNLDGIHIEDIKMEDGVWRVAGESGCLLVVTGSGTTVAEARQQAYTRIKNIMVQNMFYRTDIGLKWHTDSDKLQTWGYLY
ncbi:MAG TPA: phosphoribosylglycinamide synthetase C domain-containing protein [Candidatus Paceibacterota bacterium]